MRMILDFPVKMKDKAQTPLFILKHGSTKMKKFIFLLWTLLIAAVTAYLVNPQFLSERYEETPSVDRIREVAKVVSIEYFMSDIIEYHNDNMWPFRNTNVLVIAKAKVLAGFDLKKKFSINIVESEDDNNPDKRREIHIILPPPRIIAVEPNYRYYDISGSVPIETHNWILLRAKNTLRSSAIEAGILEDAKSSIHSYLRQMFYTYDDIHVSFSDSSPLTTSEEIKNISHE